MLNKEKITKILKDKHPYLESEYGVKTIGLFGSYARNEQKRRSDIDIIVEFSKPIGLRFIELTEYLEKTLGKKIDIITPAGLKGIRIKGIAERIKENIIYV